jgi:hypothetical protein
MGKEFGFFAEAPRLFGKTLFKGHGLLETTTLRHDWPRAHGS